MNEKDNVLQETEDIAQVELEGIDFIDATESENIIPEETFEAEVNVEEPEVFIIESEEAFPPMDTSGNIITHEALLDRNNGVQHELSAIRDLPEIIDRLALPHQVYTTGVGFAEFRQWADKNPGAKNREGYFVSLDTNGNINLCDGTKDVYGVVVNNSAICGNQDEKYNLLNPTENKANDWQYAKVCLLGDVRVRVNPSENIQPGDYVLPYEDGYASKYGGEKEPHKIGFRVSSIGSTSLQDKDKTETIAHYVTISLVPQNDNVNRVLNELKGTQEGLGNITIQIGKLEDNFADIKNNNITLGDNFDDLKDLVGDLKDSVTNVTTQLPKVEDRIDKAEQKVDATKEIISTMHTDASAKATQAVSDATSALAKADELIEDMRPITLWSTSDGKYSGAIGVIERANDQETLLADIITRTDENGTGLITVEKMINEQGARIQNLVAYADRYSVGQYSPSYGLSVDEANGILHDGHIYVPTREYTESSPIYNCKLTVGLSEGTQCYFQINGVNYTFTVPQDLSVGTILDYDSNLNEVSIRGQEVSTTVKPIDEIDGMSLLAFNSEQTYTFEIGENKAYRWTKDEHTGICSWKIAEDIALFTFTENVPTKMEKDDLWFIHTINDSTVLADYEAGTLYRYDGKEWVAVATVEGNMQARSISLITQTDKKLSSTYTNLRGDVSNIEQTVDKISTAVTNVEGQVSSIQQEADSIVMGTFDSEQSSSLGLLLNGLFTAAETEQHIWISEFEGALAVDGFRYSVAPTWDEENEIFVFDEVKQDVNGIYYFATDYDHTMYIKDIGTSENPIYRVYTVGSIAFSSINTRTSENEATIDLLTKFQTDNNEAIAAYMQKVDGEGAESVLTAEGVFIALDNVSTSISEDEKERINNTTKYKVKPTYNADKKAFEFDDTAKSDDGTYFVLQEEPDYYYKLFTQGDGTLAYEKYKAYSSGSAYLAQKVDKNGSSIGMIVEDGEVKGGVLVEAINGQSNVQISADKIDLNGYVTITSLQDGGTTEVDGSRITTGIIKSQNYSGAYSNGITFTKEPPYYVIGYGEGFEQLDWYQQELSLLGSKSRAYACENNSDSIDDYYAVEVYTEEVIVGNATYLVHYYKNDENFPVPENETIVAYNSQESAWYRVVEQEGGSIYISDVRRLKSYDILSTSDTFSCVRDLFANETFDENNLLLLIEKLEDRVELFDDSYIISDQPFSLSYDDGSYVDAEEVSGYSIRLLVPEHAEGEVRFSFVSGQSKTTLFAGSDESRGMCINLDAGAIDSDNFKLDRNGNVEMSGKISATSGYIGDEYGNGFDILQQTEHDDDIGEDVSYYYLANKQYSLMGEDSYGTKGVFISPNGIGLGHGGFSVDKYGKLTIGGGNLVADNCGNVNIGRSAFRIGCEGNLNIGNENFVVDPSGNLTTNGGVTLNNSNLEGKISTITLGDGNMTLTSTKGNEKSSISLVDGNLTLSGGIALNGKITWNNEYSPVHVLYATAQLNPPTHIWKDEDGDYNYSESVKYNEVEDKESEDDNKWWHRVFQEEATSDYPEDYYASYTYDDGQTWTSAIKIRGKNGETGPAGPAGADGNPVDVQEMLKNVYGITTTYIDPSKVQSPYIASPNIEGGTITGGYINGGYFYVTGIGEPNKTDSAYYICSGDTDDIKGYIRYDTNGFGEKEMTGDGDFTVTIGGKEYTFTADEFNNRTHDAQNRVWFTTTNGVAMKFQSGGNMSFSAGATDGTYGVGDGTIYFASKVHFMGEVTGNIAKNLKITFN